MIIIDLFNALFFGPIVNLLVFILHTLEGFGIPGAFGFSIVILSLIIRFLVWPFFTAQLRSAKKMSDLRPHLSDLKAKHKDNKQALAQAQMALYKEHGVNPAAGCLPALVQLPVLIALYQSIFAFFDNNGGLDRINNLLYVENWKLTQSPDLYFLGVNLADRPSDFALAGTGLLLIPLITAGLTFIQSKMMAPAPVKQYPSDSPKEKKEKAEKEDMMVAMQSQMVFMMPLMVGFFAFQFPIGLALYWNIFTILGIVQQYLVAGWGGFAPLVAKVKKT